LSICTFIASDSPLCEAAPQKEYPLAICVDEGRVYDGGADDNAYLHTLLLGISPIIKQALRVCLKTFDKREREADNREKQAGVGENASISK